MYRGQTERFTKLLASYHAQAGQFMAALPARLEADAEQINIIATALQDFAKACADSAALTKVRSKLGEEHGISDEAVAEFQTALVTLQAGSSAWDMSLSAALDECASRHTEIVALAPEAGFSPRQALQQKLEAASPLLKQALAALEARHKAWLKLLEQAEKSLRARQWEDFDGEACKAAKKALLPRDLKKRETVTVRDLSVEACKRAAYFIAQGHWLLQRFPHGLYADVPGLCKMVTREEIAENDYSLTPGRYVGVSAGGAEEEDQEAFVARMREIHVELDELNNTAWQLSSKIQTLIAEIIE